MLNKTSSILFLPYGEAYSDLSAESSKRPLGINRKLQVTNTNINFLYQSSEDVYLKATQGIIALIVTKNIDANLMDEFIIHRVVKINKGVYYNFIAVSEDCTIEISSLSTNVTKSYILDHSYTHEKIVPSLQIKEILSYYYSTRATDYLFPGETGNHWELTFVDNGILESKINDTTYKINSYDVVLYAPGQFHNQMTTKDTTCSYLTVIFDMSVSSPALLENKVFHADREIVRAIEHFVKASGDNQPFDRDLMVSYLQIVLIKLLRASSGTNSVSLKASPMQQKFENELLDEILIYINESIFTPLSIEELCHQFSMSRSSLQALFKNNLQIAPKQYISTLKLKKAKELIKEDKYTISEVSNILGYASIHYFSRIFKSEFGMSPSEYAKKIYE